MPGDTVSTSRCECEDDHGAKSEKNQRMSSYKETENFDVSMLPMIHSP